MHLFPLARHLPADTLQAFRDYLYGAQWYYGAPGGFVTNHPKRQVTAFGNGAPIDSSGRVGESGWPVTYWTAKMSASQVSLHTRPEPMPQPLADIVPALRQMFQKAMPGAQLTDYSLSIAVCNYYTDPDMNIAAHTDDNPWYPEECEAGPVFASITLYPEGEPESESDYARFQIQHQGKWVPVMLPHESVLIMPSGTPHRVLAHSKSQRGNFRPRINLTFRSVFPKSVNPLMNAMAVANHTRYYRIPHAISYPDDVSAEVIRPILEAYNRFAVHHGASTLQVHACPGGKQARTQARREQIAHYKTHWGNIRPTTNMVLELFQMVNQVVQ